MDNGLFFFCSFDQYSQRSHWGKLVPPVQAGIEARTMVTLSALRLFLGEGPARRPVREMKS